MIRISIHNNLNKINIIINYVLKYSSRLWKELCKRYLIRAKFYVLLTVHLHIVL